MEEAKKPEQLSDDKGLYAVIRKVQELKKHAYHGPDHSHAVLVAVAGPSGVGKTYFVKRVAGIIPSVCISLDQYVKTTSEQPKSADDPANFDYDLLFQNLSGLKYGQDVWAPRYNFKTNQRDGFYKVVSKNAKVVVVEGTFVLNERVRHLFDLRVGVSGGVHSDLVKRIMRDTQTTSAMRDKNSSEIITRISETVFPMYNEYFKPQLDSVHIHVRNDSSPFSGFLTNATYTLKSCKEVPTEEVEAYLATLGDGKWDHHESIETGDIYLLPPGEDQETCRNWIRMRLRHGSYSLVFEEYISDGPMLISPSMSFEVSLQVLQGLMSLGYVVGATIKRVSHVYVTSKAVSSSSKRLSIKYDDIGVLGRSFIQIESKDRLAVEEAGRALQMEGTFVPQSYIELLQLERLNNEWVHEVQELNKLAKENPEIVFSPPSSPKKEMCAASVSPKIQQKPPSGMSRKSAKALFPNSPSAPNLTTYKGTPASPETENTNLLASDCWQSFRDSPAEKGENALRAASTKNRRCSDAGREFDALIMDHPVANTPANQAYLNQVERLNQMEHEGQLADNAASKLVMLAQTDHSVTYSPTTQNPHPTDLLMQQIDLLNEAQAAMSTQLAALHSLSSHKRAESRGLGPFTYLLAASATLCISTTVFVLSHR